jgi:hypothetical protein
VGNSELKMKKIELKSISGYLGIIIALYLLFKGEISSAIIIGIIGGYFVIT